MYYVQVNWDGDIFSPITYFKTYEEAYVYYEHGVKQSPAYAALYREDLTVILEHYKEESP